MVTVVSTVEMTQEHVDPAVNRQGFTLLDHGLGLYTIHVLVDLDRDVYLDIAAQDGIQAEQIARTVYGNCLGVTKKE
jgi:hypothetical protein